MNRAARVWVIGLTIGTAAGCVTQGQYDAAVEQQHAIRRDLNIAKAEELALTQQAKMLESLRREAQTDAMGASGALQRAKNQAETQQHTAEERLATLQRMVSQLVTQQLTLRDKLEDAKGDTVALKEVVAAYRMKLSTEFETPAPDESPEAASSPALDSPSLTASAEAGSLPDATSAEPPRKTQPAEPPEESVLSAIMKWLMSLWRSLVSLWREIFF